MNPSPTVFLVDDDESARVSLTFLIETAGYRVMAFESAEMFLRNWEPGQPGCLVLDVRMSPGMSGLELQDKLVELNGDLPILFISGHSEIDAAIRAFRGGAVDFIKKPIDNDDFLQRLSNAIQRDAERRHQHEPDPGFKNNFQRLTPRERQFLEGMLEGLSIKQLSQRFSVSIQTAAKHRARTLEKLQAPNEIHLLHRLGPNWRMMIRGDDEADGNRVKQNRGTDGAQSPDLRPAVPSDSF